MRQYTPQGNLPFIAVSSGTNFKLEYIYQNMVLKFETLSENKGETKRKNSVLKKAK